MKLAPKPVKEISQDGITLNQATTLLGDTIYDSKPTHEKWTWPSQSQTARPEDMQCLSWHTLMAKEKR